MRIPKPSKEGLYHAADFATVTSGAAVSDATPGVVASRLDIDAEWRFFIVDQEVVGCSLVSIRRLLHGSRPHG